MICICDVVLVLFANAVIDSSTCIRKSILNLMSRLIASTTLNSHVPGYILLSYTKEALYTWCLFSLLFTMDRIYHV